MLFLHDFSRSCLKFNNLWCFFPLIWAGSNDAAIKKECVWGPVYMETSCPWKGGTLPAKSTLVCVYMRKMVTPMLEPTVLAHTQLKQHSYMLWLSRLVWVSLYSRHSEEMGAKKEWSVWGRHTGGDGVIHSFLAQMQTLIPSGAS